MNGTSVVVDSNCKHVEYFHMMFDEHQLVFADGVWSESFFPGSYAISALDKNTHHEIEFLFPHLQADDPGRSYGKLGYPKLKKKMHRIFFMMMPLEEFTNEGLSGFNLENDDGAPV